MTASAGRPPGPGTPERGRGGPGRADRHHAGSTAKLVAACAVLVLAYVAVAVAGDVRAWSGSDPGGKLLTIESMAKGGPTDVDIGYWAADDDPGGDLHPVLNTERQGDAWVQSTPPLFALPASVLYRIAGIAGVLVLTVGGAVLAALGARRIALFLASSAARGGTAEEAPDDRPEASAPVDAVARTAGWSAFWLVGLGPVVVHYVADVWEHVPALGLALGGLGLIAAPLLDRRPISIARAVTVGIALGGACALRREVVVWVAALAIAGVLTPSLRRCWTWATAASGAVAAVAVVAGNLAIERALSPSTASGGRVSTQTSQAGLLDGRRDDAWLSSLSVGPRIDGRTIALSLLVLCGLVLLAIAATRRLDRRSNVVVTAAGVALTVVGYVLAATQLLLIPGAIPSQPVSPSAIGAARGPQRSIAIAAIAAWPVVWMVQWRGGMAFQFGGRYLMVGSALLVVVGAASISRVGWRRPAAIVLVVATAGTTLWSAAVHVERSRTLAAAGTAVARQTEGDIVVLAFPFGRDTVAVRPADGRWLQAIGADELDRAVGIARSAGVDEIAVVTRTGTRATLPAERVVATAEVGESPLPGTEVTAVSEIDYLRGDHLRVVRLRFTG